MNNAVTKPSEIALSDYRPIPALVRPLRQPETFRVPAIDAHNHLGRRHSIEWDTVSAEAIIDVMDSSNVSGIINLDGYFGDELEANLDRYDRRFAGRFATFCRIDWSLCQTSGWPDKVAGSLRDSASRGAAGLKIAKSLGLGVQDEQGELILCDDPRLEPMWDAVAVAGLPVLIHVGDPVAFFTAPGASNERIEELAQFPDWSFYDEKYPRLERILDGLEEVVSNRSDITFIGAHVGCYAEDLEWVDRMLRSYDNFNIDISARIAELGRRPYRCRRLMIDHANRILLGTDSYPPSHSVYGTYAEFLETADEYFPYADEFPPPQGRWYIYGLDLPLEILEAVEGGNARRLVPRLAS